MTVDKSFIVGYKPPPPAFQIGKALVGKISARQNCCDVPNEAESDKSPKRYDYTASIRYKATRCIEYKGIG
jgi:hypothetical protein